MTPPPPPFLPLPVLGLHDPPAPEFVSGAVLLPPFPLNPAAPPPQKMCCEVQPPVENTDI